jgi:hypothetical protein
MKVMLLIVRTKAINFGFRRLKFFNGRSHLIKFSYICLSFNKWVTIEKRREIVIVIDLLETNQAKHVREDGAIIVMNLPEVS